MKNKSNTLNKPGSTSVMVAIVGLLISSAFLFAQDYVGHDMCQTCHGSIYDDYIQTGHPYKLNKVEEGTPPTYPFSTVPNPPEGVSWADVSYVIGGYGWKARFVDTNGYIITGSAVQWNLDTEEWVGYHSSEAVGTKPYNCGSCHTTGWSLFEDNGGFRQDDLPGMAGTFAAPGITCEACHGPGSDHIADPSKFNILKDTSKELCGSCHTRDAEHRIAASGGFIKHHEQYDEMINSPHRNLQCGTCHDPHKGVKYDGLGGLKNPNNCVNCHSSVKMKLPVKDGMSCSSCHMPLASKSAVTTGVDGLLGDIHSHTFRLNTDFNAPMFTEDGKFVLLDDDGNAIVKVDFACIDCHDGSGASVQSIESFYENASIIHDTWGNAVDTGGGWRFSNWLGYINTDSEPWVYSTEQGWLYIHDQASELDMYMWQSGTAQWLYTTRDIYPWVFDFNTGQWVVQGI